MFYENTDLQKRVKVQKKKSSEMSCYLLHNTACTALHYAPDDIGGVVL